MPEGGGTAMKCVPALFSHKSAKQGLQRCANVNRTCGTSSCLMIENSMIKYKESVGKVAVGD